MENGIILTQHVSLPQAPLRGLYNGNILVVDPDYEQFRDSVVLPNILQGNSSFVVFDRGGTILSASRERLENMGYEIRVIAVDSTGLIPDGDQARVYYNPFCCVKTLEDSANLADILMSHNTTFCNPSANAGICGNAERALLISCISYVATQCKEADQNFSTVVNLLNTHEKDQVPNLESVLQDLAKEYPDHPAVSSYFKLKHFISPNALRSLCLSCWLRLWPYGPGLFRKPPTANTIDLISLGDKKVALFFVSDTDTSMSTLLYDTLTTQAITALKSRAAAIGPSHHLPNHVRFFVSANFGDASLITRKFCPLLRHNISCVFYAPRLSSLRCEPEHNLRSFIDRCHTQLYSVKALVEKGLEEYAHLLPEDRFYDIHNRGTPLDVDTLAKPQTLGPSRKIPTLLPPSGLSFDEYMLFFPRAGVFRDKVYRQD